MLGFFLRILYIIYILISSCASQIQVKASPILTTNEYHILTSVTPTSEAYVQTSLMFKPFFTPENLTFSVFLKQKLSWYSLGERF